MMEPWWFEKKMDLTDITNLKLHLPEFAISDLSDSPFLFEYSSRLANTKTLSNVIIYIKYSQNSRPYYECPQNTILSKNNPIIINKDNWKELTKKTTLQSIRKFLSCDDNDKCVICLETNESGSACDICGSAMCNVCNRKHVISEFKRTNTTIKCPICRDEVSLRVTVSQTP